MGEEENPEQVEWGKVLGVIMLVVWIIFLIYLVMRGI